MPTQSQPPAETGAVNSKLFDRFALAHAAAGFAFNRFNVSFTNVVLLAVGWELIERPLKDHFPELFPHSSQDTIENAIGDVMAVLLGWRLGSYAYKVGL